MDMAMTGKQIKAVREQAGLTPQEFARALGYHGKDESLYNQMWRYELGIRPIPTRVERLVEMFDAYGVPKKFYEGKKK